MEQQELAARLKTKFHKVKLCSKGGVRIPCPTCTPAKALEFKRYVYPQAFYSNCYICGQKLKIVNLLGDTTYVPSEATKVEPTAEHPQARTLPFKQLELLKNLPSDHPAVKFLNKDHLFNLELYSDVYKIGFIPSEGGEDIKFGDTARFSSAGSLWFPMFHKGDYVGWQLRYIPGYSNADKMIRKKIKYLHVFLKSNYLFNYDRAKDYETVVVMEGVKKALKLPNGVASLGKDISDKQVELLSEWSDIVVLLDGGEKAQKKAREVTEKLKAYPRKCINVDPNKYGFDSPDEMTTLEILAAIREERNKNEPVGIKPTTS